MNTYRRFTVNVDTFDDGLDGPAMRRLTVGDEGGTQPLVILAPCDSPLWAADATRDAIGNAVLGLMSDR